MSTSATSADMFAASSLVQLSSNVPSTSKVISPDHHGRTLSRVHHPSTNPITDATENQNRRDCIKRIAFLVSQFKLKNDRKYISKVDNEFIVAKARLHFLISPEVIITSKQIQRAMKHFDTTPLLQRKQRNLHKLSVYENLPKTGPNYDLNAAALLLDLPDGQAPTFVGGIIVMDILVNAVKDVSDTIDMIPNPTTKRNCVQLYKYLRAIFDSQGEEANMDGAAPILYICGSNGTGKTTTIRYMLNYAKERSSKNDDDDAESDSVIYINCSDLPTSLSAKKSYEFLLQKYEINDLQFRDRGTPRHLDGVTVLVFDDVDIVLKSSGMKSTVKKLLKIASRKESLLAIVGLSNCVSNDSSEKLLKMGLGNNKVVFPTYKIADFLEMFRCLVGYHSISKQTVEFVASKVAHCSGNARLFFDFISRTMEATILRLENNKCENRFLFSEWSPDHSGPLTRIKDAMQVFSVDSPNTKDTILSLPSYQSQILILGTACQKMLVGKTSFTMNMFYTLCRQAQSNDLDVSALDQHSFRDIIERLQDTGLIKISLLNNEDSYHRRKKVIGPTAPMSTYNFFQSTITFEHALEDVESAVGEIVSDNKHYSSLLNRFKNILEQTI